MVNCLAKLFTKILSTRINTFCNAYNILPEWQSGFREGRSCLDNIFTLNSLIQTHITKNKGKLYALFLDFKGAFNSVNHGLLWYKLSKCGISSKIINILKYLYDNAIIKVESNNNFTDPIKVTKGVLQGETLSPLLFSLFLSDLEVYLLSKGIRGVSMTHLVEILLLGYADDIVILADSYIVMKKILKHLFDYCNINDLEPNLSKSKLILFQKGGHGHKKKRAPFLFGTEEVEYVKEYTYLGITFTQTALFTKAANELISKAKYACANTLTLCKKIGISSWKVFEKLFQSLVRSILLYASPIYAIRYLQDVERVQSLYIKRILNLPHCTPDYALRLEVGVSHVGVLIFKQTLNWIIKLMSMPDNRYPKICFLRQLSLNSSSKILSKYSWVKQIRENFFDLISENFNSNSLASGLLNRKNELINTYKIYLHNTDLVKREKSTSLILYTDLKLQENCQKYFNIGLTWKALKILAQIRFLNVYSNRIIIDSNIYRFNNNDYCFNCSKVNDFVHRVVECPVFDKLREKLMLKFKNNNDFFRILEEPNTCKEVNCLINLISQICTYYADR